MQREAHGAHAEIFEVDGRAHRVRREFELACRIEERFGPFAQIMRDMRGPDGQLVGLPMAKLAAMLEVIFEGDETMTPEKIRAHILAKGPARVAAPIVDLLMNFFLGDERFQQRFEALQASEDRPDPRTAASSPGESYSERPHA